MSEDNGLKVFITKPLLPPSFLFVLDSVCYFLMNLLVLFILFSLSDSFSISATSIDTFKKIIVLPIFCIFIFVIVVAIFKTLFDFVCVKPNFKLSKSGLALVIDGDSFYSVCYNNNDNSNKGLIKNKNKFYEVIKSVCSCSYDISMDNITGIYCCSHLEVVSCSKNEIILNFPKDIDYLGDSKYDLILRNNFNGFEEVKEFLLDHDRGDYLD